MMISKQSERNAGAKSLLKFDSSILKPVQAIIDRLGADYEVKVSGTVYNIYLKNKADAVIASLSEQKITSHDFDLEDIYFYMTGKISYEKEGQLR